jgi:protein-S-isoprenylcysteine O-methyltransferase Ste14
MTSRLEDLIGKVFMVVVFLYLALGQFGSIVAIIQNRDSIDFWSLALTSRVLGLLFLFMVVALTIFRQAPKQSAAGIEPRLTALAGTFALMLLIVLPTGSVGPEMLALATALMIIGSALSIYCLLWLGRSFSIMATARSLVTSGPYGLVRHPLYAAEAISVIGFLIANWSAAALIVGVIQFAFQFRRMVNEERVLRSTFPEYADYARVVPMFIPKALMPLTVPERG